MIKPLSAVVNLLGLSPERVPLQNKIEEAFMVQNTFCESAAASLRYSCYLRSSTKIRMITIDARQRCIHETEARFRIRLVIVIQMLQIDIVNGRQI